ncbi:hypothetical protein FQA39_LY07670 [Lamprigera yunnana]|nr:hypothetical protein FQA39_LY07670 [Lamprigera yunnana]
MYEENKNKLQVFSEEDLQEALNVSNFKFFTNDSDNDPPYDTPADIHNIESESSYRSPVEDDSHVPIPSLALSTNSERIISVS